MKLKQAEIHFSQGSWAYQRKRQDILCTLLCLYSFACNSPMRGIASVRGRSSLPLHPESGVSRSKPLGCVPDSHGCSVQRLSVREFPAAQAMSSNVADGLSVKNVRTFYIGGGGGAYPLQVFAGRAEVRSMPPPRTISTVN